MTCSQLAKELDFEILNLEDGDREITGGYTGDLLSWVMSRAKAGDLWVTIMTNVNTVAVASLTDVACVVIAENAEVSQDVIDKANAQGINLFRTARSSFEVCRKVHFDE